MSEKKRKNERHSPEGRVGEKMADEDAGNCNEGDHVVLTSQTEKTPEMDERRGNRRRERREEGMAPWKQGEISRERETITGEEESSAN